MRVKTLKVICVFLLMILVCTMLTNLSLASQIDWQSELNNVDVYEDNNANTKINKTVETIIGAVRTAGTGVAVLMLVILAAKYMMAAPGDKADIKKHAVIYVVGAVVLFATSGILGIIAKFAGVIT